MRIFFSQFEFLSLINQLIFLIEYIIRLAFNIYPINLYLLFILLKGVNYLFVIQDLSTHFLSIFFIISTHLSYCHNLFLSKVVLKNLP